MDRDSAGRCTGAAVYREYGRSFAAGDPLDIPGPLSQECSTSRRVHRIAGCALREPVSCAERVAGPVHLRPEGRPRVRRIAFVLGTSPGDASVVASPEEVRGRRLV